MASWTVIAATDVVPGDRIRFAGQYEFTVARVDPDFLGLDVMLCFIEDTPERWHAYPTMTTAEVEVER
jgi:hypothetical protein